MYRLFINFIFDLIIKYVNVYAIKFHILYDSSVIEEINDLRNIILLIDFKKKFLDIFNRFPTLTKRFIFSHKSLGKC